MDKYHVYILKNLKDGNLYIGSTANLKERVKRHSAGLVRATKTRRPLMLIHSEKFSTRAEAARRETYFKKLRNAEYIMKLISQ